MRLVVDTSAIAAILFNEPERASFVEVIAATDPVISAGTAIELLRVVQLALGTPWVEKAQALMSTYSIEIVPVDGDQVRLAQDGMTRFGKGRGAEPAVLNFGDLFAYALARQLSAPLLFKGNDFAMTDVASAAALGNSGA